MSNFYGLNTRDLRRAIPGRKKRYQIKELWSNHNEILRLKVLGVSNVRIAEIVGMAKETISLVLNSDIAIAKLKIMEGARDAETIEVAVEVKKMIPKALKIYEKIIENKDEKASLSLQKATADTIVKELGGYEAPKKIAVGHFSAEAVEGIKTRGKQLAKEIGHLIDV